MGTAPPPDDPSPAAQDAASASAGFSEGPPVASLCGFSIPGLRFKFGVKLPGLFAFPPKLPFPHIGFGLSCSTDNPLNITAGVSYGGGRTSNGLPDPDNDDMDSAS
jgi:hypothetical protein